MRRTTFMDRMKNALRAFQGKPIGSITYGIDIKRCDKCEYKSDLSMRDHLMITVGARAAYMCSAGMVDLPEGLDGECDLAWFVKRTVDKYLQDDTDINFDEYIETALINEYAILLEE